MQIFWVAVALLGLFVATQLASTAHWQHEHPFHTDGPGVIYQDYHIENQGK